MATKKKTKPKQSDKRDSSVKGSEYPDYEIMDPEGIGDSPDVILDVPVVKVDEIDIEVDDLRAAVSVRAELRDLVKLNVGVAARLGEVELNIQGVEAQALLKARLNNVSLILGRVLTTLDRNPTLLESVGKSVESVGAGGQRVLQGTGEAVGDVGEGGGEAVQEIGQGAGRATGQIGEGAGRTVQSVGQGAGQAAKGIGEGAGRGVGEIGKGGKEALSGVGEGVEGLTGTGGRQN